MGVEVDVIAKDPGISLCKLLGPKLTHAPLTLERGSVDSSRVEQRGH